MPFRLLTRRRFCLAAVAASVLTGRGLSQVAQTRLNVAQIDRERILKAAAAALTHAPAPNKDAASEPFLQFALDVAALGGAHAIAPDPRYLAHALEQLTAWLVTPETRLPTTVAEPDAILNTAPLAEVAQALPLLFPDIDGVPAPRIELVRAWFKEYLGWLTTGRTALLAKDAKNHHGASWLLQVGAYAHLGGDEAAMTEARHRFKTYAIRAQLDANGFFMHELTTDAPLGNSLLALDLMAGACVLLSTRFDSLWEHELQDGPGMRAAIARYAPYIKAPGTWPYPADATHFHDLPGRRPALLFAARAYQQAEYATLWRTLNPDPAGLETARRFPITQPVLWQPLPHALAI